MSSLNVDLVRPTVERQVSSSLDSTEEGYQQVEFTKSESFALDKTNNKKVTFQDDEEESRHEESYDCSGSLALLYPIRDCCGDTSVRTNSCLRTDIDFDFDDKLDSMSHWVRSFKIDQCAADEEGRGEQELAEMSEDEEDADFVATTKKAKDDWTKGEVYEDSNYDSSDQMSLLSFNREDSNYDTMDQMSLLSLADKEDDSVATEDVYLEPSNSKDTTVIVENTQMSLPLRTITETVPMNGIAQMRADDNGHGEKELDSDLDEKTTDVNDSTRKSKNFANGNNEPISVDAFMDQEYDESTTDGIVTKRSTDSADSNSSRAVVDTLFRALSDFDKEHDTTGLLPEENQSFNDEAGIGIEDSLEDLDADFDEIYLDDANDSESQVSFEDIWITENAMKETERSNDSKVGVDASIGKSDSNVQGQPNSFRTSIANASGAATKKTKMASKTIRSRSVEAKKAIVVAGKNTRARSLCAARKTGKNTKSVRDIAVAKSMKAGKGIKEASKGAFETASVVRTAILYEKNIKTATGAAIGAAKLTPAGKTIQQTSEKCAKKTLSAAKEVKQCANVAKKEAIETTNVFEAATSAVVKGGRVKTAAQDIMVGTILSPPGQAVKKAGEKATAISITAGAKAKDYTGSAFAAASSKTKAAFDKAKSSPGGEKVRSVAKAASDHFGSQAPASTTLVTYNSTINENNQVSKDRTETITTKWRGTFLHGCCKNVESQVVVAAFDIDANEKVAAEQFAKAREEVKEKEAEMAFALEVVKDSEKCGVCMSKKSTTDAVVIFNADSDVIEDDNPDSSDEDESIVENFSEEANENKDNAEIDDIDASSCHEADYSDLGRIHSAIDVQLCATCTCAKCKFYYKHKQANPDVTFIKIESHEQEVASFDEADTDTESTFNETESDEE